MKKVKKSLKILIKGVEWTVYVQPNLSYIRQHGNDSGAITYINDKDIFFNSDHVNTGYIRHELTHAFVASSGINSSSLDQDQFEELFCEIVEEHYHDIGSLTDKIINFILK